MPKAFRTKDFCIINFRNPRILECTLRDGSYRIDFQFTEDDTRIIAAALERVGFDMIEVGHGVGLGATESGKGVAAESDEIYMKATAETLSTAEWGMFCIPGIASLRHIDLAAEYEMSFIRIGVNIENYIDAFSFIEKAKYHGMYVCTNFMKSYVTDPDTFARFAIEVENAGTDLVYIVDSAGGMLPREVERYVSAIRSQSETLAIGFHGHNNLGMAVANCLSAVEHGATIVDSSLQGFGRSAGNAPTEQLLCALIRAGYDLGIEPIAVMDCGELYIQPRISSKGHSSIDVVAGLAQFHSSYMKLIEIYSNRYQVDPRHLIIAICNRDRTEASESLVEAEAERLAEDNVCGTWKPLYDKYAGGEQEPSEHR